MGKYVLLMTFASALALAYFTQQSNQTARATNEDRAERQEMVLARQIARSAFNEAMSQAKRGLGDFSERTDVEYEGGEFDILYSVPTPSSEIIDGVNWRMLDVKAEGRFPVEEPQTTYRITAAARQAISEDVNAITAGESVDFTASGPGCDTCINGNDGAGGEARRGISLPPDKDEARDPEVVCDELRNGNNNNGSNGNNNDSPVVGSGEGGCDIKKRSDDRDDEVDRVMDAIGERIRESSSSKVERYGGVSFDNNTSPENTRILYIEDGVEAKISQDWHGLVFVSKSEKSDSNNESSVRGKVTVNGKHSIKGGLIMEEGSKFRLNGGGTGNNVDYHTGRLLGLVDVLPMLGEPVEVMGRSGQVANGDEESSN